MSREVSRVSPPRVSSAGFLHGSVDPSPFARLSLLLTVLLCLAPSRIDGILCPAQCDHAQCRAADAQCPGSKVPDLCGCCLECAKQVGESCGGVYNLEGTCEMGLLCMATPPPSGGPISRDLPGVCAEATKRQTHNSDEDPCDEITCDDDDEEEEDFQGARTTRGREGDGGNPPFCPLDSRAVLSAERPPTTDLPGATLREKCCRARGKKVCQCLPCPGQNSVVCGPRQLPILVRAGTVTPGTCCDVYKCVEKEAFCKTIQCNDASSNSSSSSSSSPEEDDDVTSGGSCPDDSTEVGPDSKFDVCCPVARWCQCKPPSTCPDLKLTCPPGNVKRLLTTGLGIPGSCCDTYGCRNVKETTCAHHGKIRLEGEQWTVDSCERCRCEAGVAKCFKVECPIFPEKCEWLGHLGNDSCCKVCKGCSRNGKFYENDQTWESDTCITCRCVEGQSYCQATYCTVKCTRPKLVEGQCCPVCDEDDRPATLSPHCLFPHDCNLMCEMGYARDEVGCPLCRCSDGHDDDDVDDLEESCHVSCPFPKYVLDPVSGRMRCFCPGGQILPTSKPPTSDPMTRCKPMDDCNRQCLYGYKSDSNGCRRCRCNRCPRFECGKKCPAGFKVNSDGCRICKCNDSGIFEPPVLPGTFHPGSASNKGRPCSSANGRRMSDGQTWWDGCRRCFCHGGLEMCELVTCPPLKCTNPIMAPGSCCLTCPGVQPPKVLEGPSTCLSSDGRYFVDGETWSLDQCTTCICHVGNPLCTIEACPPLLCHHPVHLADSCCPICPNQMNTNLFPASSSSPRQHGSRKSGQQRNRSCLTAEGVRSSHGDTWRVSPCQSCVCMDGQINCFSQTCPILGCNRTVLKKGHCCPSCLEKPVHYCTYDGLTYDNGESWLVDDCMTCACMDGHVLCTTSVCEPQSCPHPVFVPGKCCPICTDERGSSGHHHQHQQINMTLIVSLVSIVVLFAVIIILGMFTWLCLKLAGVRRRSSDATLATPLPCLSSYRFFPRRDQLSNDEKSVSSSLQPLNSIPGAVAGRRQQPPSLHGGATTADGSPVMGLGSGRQADSSQKLRLSQGDPTFLESHLSAGLSSLTTASLASSSLSSSAAKKRLSSLDGSGSTNDPKLGVDDEPTGPDGSLPPVPPRRQPPAGQPYSQVNVVVSDEDLPSNCGDSWRYLEEEEDRDRVYELNRSSDASLGYEPEDAPAGADSAGGGFFRKAKNYSGNIDVELTRHLLSSSPTAGVTTAVSNRKSW